MLVECPVLLVWLHVQGTGQPAITTLFIWQYNPLTQSVVVSKSIARLDRTSTLELQVVESVWSDVHLCFTATHHQNLYKLNDRLKNRKNTLRSCTLMRLLLVSKCCRTFEEKWRKRTVWSTEHLNIDLVIFFRILKQMKVDFEHLKFTNNKKGVLMMIDG